MSSAHVGGTRTVWDAHGHGGARNFHDAAYDAYPAAPISLDDIVAAVERSTARGVAHGLDARHTSPPPPPFNNNKSDASLYVVLVVAAVIVLLAVGIALASAARSVARNVARATDLMLMYMALRAPPLPLPPPHFA